MSEMALDGCRALVTGAARRTGRALALALAHAGADVAVHYRSSSEDALDVVEEIRRAGRRATAVRADLADAHQAEHAANEAAAALGPIDILVNNVGTIVWKTLDELSPEDWKNCLDGTVTATWHACRAVTPGMRTRGFGRIVNILDADADALAPAVYATPYKIGKTGSLVLTKSLAKNEGPYGITVNAISPGVLEDSKKKVPLERIPAGRPGTYADLESALLFLVSKEAGYVTGTNLKVSGGYLI